VGPTRSSLPRLFLRSSPSELRLSVDTYDVTGAELLDVVRWAQEHAGSEKLYSVALVADDERRDRGLVWLVGCDANDGPSESLDAMMARRGIPVVLSEPSA
jgi:hypothetical protein